MAIAHLMYGFAGAGKSTVSRKMEKEIGAVRFCPDEWVEKLYGRNPPANEFQEYFDRVYSLIVDNAIRLLELNQDVILDVGYWSRSSRDEIRAKVLAVGATVKLYHVNCSVETMRNRVFERSKNSPNSLWIDDNAFQLFLTRFEPLGSDEECTVINNE